MAAAATYELPAVAACGAPFPHHRLAWDSSLDQADPVQLHRFHIGFRTSTFGPQGENYLQRRTKERGKRNVRACRPGRFPTLPMLHTRPCRRPHGKPNFQISAPPRRTECQVRAHKIVFVCSPGDGLLKGGAWHNLKSRVECCAQTAPAPPSGMLRRPVCTAGKPDMCMQPFASSIRRRATPLRQGSPGRGKAVQLPAGGQTFCRRRLDA